MGDHDIFPGLARCPGGGNGSLLQYACLENPHGQRSLAGYSPRGQNEVDTAKQWSTARWMFVKERRVGRGEGERDTREMKGRKETPVLLVRTEQPEMSPSRTAPHMPIWALSGGLKQPSPTLVSLLQPDSWAGFTTNRRIVIRLSSHSNRDSLISDKDTCAPVFITALFALARAWKQPRCPSADEWVRKLGYIYTMEYFLAIKKNTFESILMRWMKVEPIIQSEVSQKEKHQYTILRHIYWI